MSNTFVIRPVRRAAWMVALAFAFGVVAPCAMAQPSRPFNVIPIHIASITLNQSGQLQANGFVGSHPFTAPVTLAAAPNAADPTCPILDLQLGPINLDLLGLVVTTSPICLDINAESGNGNLLGNLLCGVAGLLNNGLSVSAALGSLSAADLSTVLNSLTSMLNSVLSQLTSSSAFAGASCPVLALSLGPVNLNLLGLVVNLNNCSNGSVTVDITAVPGAGNLLGNLLCTLTNALNGGAGANLLNTLLSRIASVIGGLV